jgi:hypothetical protein
MVAYKESTKERRSRMPRSAWISAKEAALILSESSGRTITDQHVRDHARKGHIRYRPIDGRTNEYNRNDVEKLHIRKYKSKKTNQPPQITEANLPLEDVA